MNRMTMASVVGGLAILGGTGIAQAGGIDSSWVGQDAGWIAHIDIEGLVASDLGQAILDGIGHNAKNRLSLDELMQILKDGPSNDELGLALLHEIRDVTVMGSDDEDPDLVVARVSPIVNGILDAVKDEEHLSIIEHDGHSIISFGNDFGDPEGHAIILPTEVRDTLRIVIGEEIDDVVGAIAASKARRAGPGWLDGAAGKLVFVHIEDPSAMAGNDLPAMLNNTSGMEFSLEEVGGNFSANLLLDTGDAQAAQDLVAMAQGMMAMARFAASEEPELKQMLPLMNGIALEARDGAVLGNFSFEVSKMMEIIEPIIEENYEDAIDVEVDVHISE